MITVEMIKEKVADLEKEYVDFMVSHFADWKVWAEASQRMADGKEVREDEIPEPFRLEFKLFLVILEMEAQGKFDWANPRLRAIFGQLAQSPLYRLSAETITKISLRLAECSGMKTLVEIGAGRGNLTAIMLHQIEASNLPLKLIVTDIDPIVLESIEKLRSKHPRTTVETLLWDIKEPPPRELLEKVQAPCLAYERASIMYANIPAIENIASIADMIVFGDMFNYTGELYAYDEIPKRIGVQPLFYSAIKPLLDRCFRDHFMFDLRAQEELNYPNTTMLIATK